MMKYAGIGVPLIVMVFLVGLVAGCGGSSNSGKAQTSPSTAPSSTSQKPPFLYPSAYQRANSSDPMICAINNPTMVSGAKLAYGRDATAFETDANIFAPYYQQADISVVTLPQAQQQAIVGGQPTTDATAAFDYYIKHYNKGRPFILAGHSQGSNVTVNLMADYMKKNPKVYKRMIAAYVPGWSITPAYLKQNPELRFATGPDDTGVIISYNTESPTFNGTNPVVLPGAMVINPVTWNRDETPATARQNLGSIQVNSDGTVAKDAQGNPVVVKDLADAQVNTAKGVLICSTVNANTIAPGNTVVAQGIYHTFDYPFYYFDLRANAANRIDRFLKK
jgi:hypothetical protein